MTVEEVIEHCRKSLAPYKVPTMVEFIDAIPRTAVGKPDRKVLQARDSFRNECRVTSNWFLKNFTDPSWYAIITKS